MAEIWLNQLIEEPQFQYLLIFPLRLVIFSEGSFILLPKNQEQATQFPFIGEKELGVSTFNMGFHFIPFFSRHSHTSVCMISSRDLEHMCTKLLCWDEGGWDTATSLHGVQKGMQVDLEV